MHTYTGKTSAAVFNITFFLFSEQAHKQVGKDSPIKICIIIHRNNMKWNILADGDSGSMSGRKET